MSQQELTDELVERLEPPKNAPYLIVFDGGHKRVVAGFGVRVTKAGARSFILNYRVRGRGTQRRYTIGAASVAGSAGWKTAAARRRADDLRKLIDAGGDPLGELHTERDAPTMRELSIRFLEEHASVYCRPGTKKNYESLLNQIILPELGARRVSEITREDIAALHRKITSRGFPAKRWRTREELAQGDLFERPVRSRKDPARIKIRDPRPAPIRANRAIALLRMTFRLAVKWKMRADNPAADPPKNNEEDRNTFLDLDQIAAVWAALANHAKEPSANAARLLLLTGARRGEVLSATWSQFELKEKEASWTKPSAHTKQKKEHRVPLSAPAQQLLVEMKAAAEAAAKKKKRLPSPMLFPARDGVKPQAEMKRFWRTIRKEANIPAVRIHDLRHTFASVLASEGLSLPIIGRLLGHTQPKTTQRYAHADGDPLRRAVQRAGDVIAPGENKKSAEVRKFPTGETA